MNLLLIHIKAGWQPHCLGGIIGIQLHLLLHRQSVELIGHLQHFLHHFCSYPMIDHLAQKLNQFIHGVSLKLLTYIYIYMVLFGDLEKTIEPASIGDVLDELGPVYVLAEVDYGDMFTLTHLGESRPLRLWPDVTLWQGQVPDSGGQHLWFHGLIYVAT